MLLEFVIYALTILGFLFIICIKLIGGDILNTIGLVFLLLFYVIIYFPEGFING